MGRFEALDVLYFGRFGAGTFWGWDLLYLDVLSLDVMSLDILYVHLIKKGDISWRKGQLKKQCHVVENLLQLTLLERRAAKQTGDCATILRAENKK